MVDRPYGERSECIIIVRGRPLLKIPNSIEFALEVYRIVGLF